MFSMPAVAVTPDVRWPEWNRVIPQVSAWNPDTGEVQVSIEVRAIGGNLHMLSASVSWPEGFRGVGAPQKLNRLASGKSWVTIHRAVGPQQFDGWAEMLVSGLPDPVALKERIARTPEYSPVVREIMNRELAGLKEPIPIGRAIPLFVSPEIGVVFPGTWLFSRVKLGEYPPVFLWAPAFTMGSGELAQVYAGFKDALTGNRRDVAVQSLGRIWELTRNHQGFVEVSSADGQSSSLAVTVISPCLTANRLVLRGLTDLSGAIAEHRELEKSLETGPANPYLHVNWGLLLMARGQGLEAEKHFQTALREIPGMVLAADLLKGKK
jgi:hypothetical protein